MAINKKFIAFIESFSEKYPNEVSAIKQAYETCFEDIGANVTNDNNSEPVIPDASPEQLEKFKQTVDKVVPRQIEAKKQLSKTNEELQSVKDEIETENKANERTA